MIYSLIGLLAAFIYFFIGLTIGVYLKAKYVFRSDFRFFRLLLDSIFVVSVVLLLLSGIVFCRDEKFMKMNIFIRIKKLARLLPLFLSIGIEQLIIRKKAYKRAQTSTERNRDRSMRKFRRETSRLLEMNNICSDYR